MQYYSQYEQDKIINEKFIKNKKNGFFIDIGAHDGISGSNTLFFEKEMQWSGICVEPIPEVYAKLTKNRNCICENIAIWKENCIKNFKIIDGYSEMLSGLTDCYHEAHKQRIENEINAYQQKQKEIKIPCFTLNHLIKKYQINNIDLLSIDTEGSELDIISAIDFKSTKINYLLIENNYSDNRIKKLLEINDFIFLQKIAIDDLYINKNLWSQ